MKKCFFIILFFITIILSGCTHKISYLETKNIKIENKFNKTVVLIIPNETKNNIFTKHRGEDTWKFDLGDAIYSIYSKTFNDSFDKVIILSDETKFKNNLKNQIGFKVQVEAFHVDMGLFQWSEHKVNVILKTTLYNGYKLNVKTQLIKGSGESSGNKEIIAYIPVVGNLSFDKALSRAMTTSIVDSAIQSINLVKDNKKEETQ